MKHTFTSRELAHVWAHNNGEGWGKSPGNASFNGDTFSSYATVIGRRIRHKGRTAYIVDRHGFSITTSAVQSRIRQALSHEKVFSIDAGSRGQDLRFTASDLVAHYLKTAQEEEAKMPSRYAKIRAEQYARTTSHVQDALSVAQFFGLGITRLEIMLAKRAAGQADADATLKASRERQLKARADCNAKIVRQQTAKAIADAEVFIGHPEKRVQGWAMPETSGSPHLLPEDLRTRLLSAIRGHNAGLIGRWRVGENVSLSHDLPTMLRHRPNVIGRDEPQMETSKGALVPMNDAERAFKFVLKCRAKGWHRNGETFSVGTYQLDAVNAEGVVAGCHRITWDEINRFAVSQGWVNA